MASPAAQLLGRPPRDAARRSPRREKKRGIAGSPGVAARRRSWGPRRPPLGSPRRLPRARCGRCCCGRWRPGGWAPHAQTWGRTARHRPSAPRCAHENPFQHQCGSQRSLLGAGVLPRCRNGRLRLHRRPRLGAIRRARAARGGGEGGAEGGGQPGSGRGGGLGAARRSLVRTGRRARRRAREGRGHARRLRKFPQLFFRRSGPRAPRGPLWLAARSVRVGGGKTRGTPPRVASAHNRAARCAIVGARSFPPNFPPAEERAQVAHERHVDARRADGGDLTAQRCGTSFGGPTGPAGRPGTGRRYDDGSGGAPRRGGGGGEGGGGGGAPPRARQKDGARLPARAGKARAPGRASKAVVAVAIGAAPRGPGGLGGRSGRRSGAAGRSRSFKRRSGSGRRAVLAKADARPRAKKNDAYRVFFCARWMSGNSRWRARAIWRADAWCSHPLALCPSLSRFASARRKRVCTRGKRTGRDGVQGRGVRSVAERKRRAGVEGERQGAEEGLAGEARRKREKQRKDARVG